MMGTPEPEGRRARKKRETRERIVSRARDLFLEQGYDVTTVEEIAEAADISKPTFFNYFEAKASLLTEMVREIDERFRRYIEDERRRPRERAVTAFPPDQARARASAR